METTTSIPSPVRNSEHNHHFIKHQHLCACGNFHEAKLAAQTRDQGGKKTRRITFHHTCNNLSYEVAQLYHTSACHITTGLALNSPIPVHNREQNPR